MQGQGTPSSIEDALLWLNDRLGKSVAAWIAVEDGDSIFSVFDAEGELRHWSEGKAAVLAASREESPADLGLKNSLSPRCVERVQGASAGPNRSSNRPRAS
jgi:hypothetical protein